MYIAICKSDMIDYRLYIKTYRDIDIEYRLCMERVRVRASIL